MAACASDLGRWAAAGAAAVVLAGCASDAPDQASEPGLALSPAASAPALTPGTGGADRSDDVTPDDVATPDDDSTPDDDDIVLRDAPTVVDETAEIDVEDQRGDGTAVRVDEVRFASGSALVGIYGAGLDLLGWAPVQSGVQPVTIQLTRAVGSSQELIAVLHLDDGDGLLSRGDSVLVEEGEQVSEDFDYVLD